MTACTSRSRFGQGAEGIPAEQLPYLFRKHTNLGGNDERRDLRGSGLGLAICKGLVEAHGGRIRAASGGRARARSSPSRSPVAEEAGDAAVPARNRSGSPREQGERTPILVVDDDPQDAPFRSGGTRQVQAISPIVTGDHRELSRSSGRRRPHLILLDLVLPGADGLELLESVPELADLARSSSFPPTAGTKPSPGRWRTGAADYLVKPFSATELTARIRAALRKRVEPKPFMLDDLTIHYEQRRVTVAGRPVQLTATEYNLLRILSVNAGLVLTYNSLIHQLVEPPELRGTRTASAPSSSNSAASSGMPPPGRATSSTSTGSATGWPLPNTRRASSRTDSKGVSRLPPQPNARITLGLAPEPRSWPRMPRWPLTGHRK